MTRILLKLFLNNLRPASSLGIFQRRRGGVVGCDRAVAHQQHRGGGPRLVAPGCRPSLALWMIRVKTHLSLGRPSLAPWTIRVKTHLSLGRVDGATSVISFLKAMTSISSANRTLVAGARQWLLRFSFFSLFQKKNVARVGVARVEDNPT